MNSLTQRHGQYAHGITVEVAGDEATICACVALRRKVFLATYPELKDWGSEPDIYDRAGGLLVVRDNCTIVGTAAYHVGRVDDETPFWIDAFGVRVRDMLPAAAGHRVAEVGRLAIDKELTCRPLPVASAIAAEFLRRLAVADVETMVGFAFRDSMLEFYRDLTRRNGGQLQVHPHRPVFGTLRLAYFSVHLPSYSG